MNRSSGGSDVHGGRRDGWVLHDLKEELQQQRVKLRMRLKRELADCGIQREGDAPGCIGRQMVKRLGDADNASQ